MQVPHVIQVIQLPSVCFILSSYLLAQASLATTSAVY